MRLALRQLKNAPGYTLAAVTTLALAIGATTAIFSAVHAVLLKPMPIRAPEQLVVGWGTSAAASMRVLELSYLDIRDIGDMTPDIGVVASHSSSTWTAVLDGEGDPVKIPTTGVSGNFFDVLGAVPRLGRVIRAEDDHTRSAPVIVISQGLWIRQFGSDPAVIVTLKSECTVSIERLIEDGQRVAAAVGSVPNLSAHLDDLDLALEE